MTALAGCGANGNQACFEPTFAPSQDALMVGNGFSGHLAFSTHGSPFLATNGPNDAALAAGGDAMLQAAKDGGVWWINPKSASVEITKSATGGLVWGTTVVVQTGSLPDRPWLVEGPAAVLLTFQNDQGLHATVSSDGGTTWSSPALFETAHIHGRGAWCGARFIVPVLRLGQLALDSSADGRAWSSLDMSGARGDFFPALACKDEDVAVAWHGADGTLRLSRSKDGGITWGATIDVLPRKHAIESPWLALRDHDLWLATFVADNETGPADLLVVRADGQAHVGTAARGVTTTFYKERAGNSDFAFFDFAGGVFTAVYADGDGAIKLVSVS